jgi:hypothetical protein
MHTPLYIHSTCDYRNTYTQVYMRNTAYIAYVDRTYIHTATDKQTYKLIYTDLHSYCTYVIYTYIQIHIRTYIHIYTHMRLHTCIHTHTNTHRLYKHAYIHTNTHRLYKHAYIHTCMHAYVRTYIQISHGDDFWDIAPCSQKLSDVWEPLMHSIMIAMHKEDWGSKHLWNVYQFLPDYTA